MMYTLLSIKRFLLIATCLLVTGLGVTSELKGAPLYRSSDTFMTGTGHELYPRMLSGFQDGINFEWLDASSTDTVPDSHEPLQGVIFLALLVGSILRFLMSDLVRQFCRDTFDPMNWNSYQ